MPGSSCVVAFPNRGVQNGQAAGRRTRVIVVGIAVGFVAMLALLGPTELKTSDGSSSASIFLSR